jgi:DNA-binding MarR family transcriptional regulator
MTRRFGLLNKNCCSIGGVDISLIHSHILYEIDRQHEPSMQQTADALGIDITTFSRQIQALIGMKLVSKTPSVQDRRVYLLSLTMEGKFVATAIDRQMNDYLHEVLSHMNDFERETVIRSIKLLNDSMAKSKVCCTPLG